jgi:hypothetical protein
MSPTAVADLQALASLYLPTSVSTSGSGSDLPRFLDEESTVSSAADEALVWLQRCSAVTQLRALMVDEICRPFSETMASVFERPSDLTSAR